MTVLETVDRILASPWTIIGSAVAVLSQVASLPLIDPVISVVVAQAGALFTATSITGFTIAPQVGWLPTDPIQTLALVTGGLFVAIKLVTVGRAFRDKLMEE